ncbi:hypothetical protein KCU99_g69, partial [Aureobasidium melanogenum]
MGATLLSPSPQQYSSGLGILNETACPLGTAWHFLPSQSAIPTATSSGTLSRCTSIDKPILDKIENLNQTYHRLRYENGTSFRVPVFLIAPPHPFVWGRFYPRKPPVSAPRFPQDQGVESKAKQTSTNPQRHGYLSDSERASQSSLVSVRLSVLGDLHLVSAERRILNSEDRRNGFTWTTPPNLSPSSLLCLLPKRNGVWMAKLGLCKSLRSADILGLLVAFVLTAFCRLRRQQRVQVTSEADSTTLRVMCLIGY